mmetsp:Transcript_39077/g.99847  ORF Transcript_39077/g.99847 Transcript_39077/m.99847 type:complete len:231 (+) Transcript_39077:564-1256(+)
MEDEEVVHGQHPLQEVTGGPLDGRRLSHRRENPAVEDTGRHEPQDDAQNVRLEGAREPLQHKEVKDEGEEAEDDEGNPLTSCRCAEEIEALIAVHVLTWRRLFVGIKCIFVPRVVHAVPGLLVVRFLACGRRRSGARHRRGAGRDVLFQGARDRRRRQGRQVGGGVVGAMVASERVEILVEAIDQALDELRHHADRVESPLRVTGSAVVAGRFGVGSGGEILDRGMLKVR